MAIATRIGALPSPETQCTAIAGNEGTVDGFVSVVVDGGGTWRLVEEDSLSFLYEKPVGDASKMKSQTRLSQMSTNACDG